MGDQEARAKLLAALKRLDQTMASVSRLRSAVNAIFHNMVAAQDPATVRQALKEDISLVRKLQIDIIEHAAALHPVLIDCDERRHGLVNADKQPLPEAVLCSDLSLPVTAAELHKAYTWERKVQHHGAFAYGMLSALYNTKFPQLTSGQQELNSSVKPGDRLSDVDETITWVAALQPHMEIIKEDMGQGLCGLTIRLPGVLKALISLKLLGSSVDRRVRVEHVNVCSLGEEINVWGLSDHDVFRSVTQQANAALLHFTATKADQVLAAFLPWLHSFHDLFTAKCEECGKYIQHDSEEAKFMPPTARSFGSIKGKHAPFHVRCVPLATLTQ